MFGTIQPEPTGLAMKEQRYIEEWISAARKQAKLGVPIGRSVQEDGVNDALLYRP
nr:hypothetical protein [Chromobacterium sp.]